jgi:hypothetical protein
MKTLNDYITEIKAEIPNPMVQDSDSLRPMTEAEANDWYAWSAKIKQADDLSLAAKKTKEAEKAALLEKLGITEDEAKLLLS